MRDSCSGTARMGQGERLAVLARSGRTRACFIREADQQRTISGDGRREGGKREIASDRAVGSTGALLPSPSVSPSLSPSIILTALYCPHRVFLLFSTLIPLAYCVFLSPLSSSPCLLLCWCVSRSGPRVSFVRRRLTVWCSPRVCWISSLRKCPRNRNW